ncbi:peroxiredoxin [Balneolaceae bacterium ANBcel3]|nr:peroxiredoxin [Balneolaceae bacterium ANBcel3]
MPLSPGTKAPDFTLPDNSGNLISLENLTQNGLLALFFYPRDESPGCTRQACHFRDHYEKLLERGVSVAGISMGTVEMHNAFAHRHGFRYPLLADEDGSVHKEYGCLSLMGLWPRRVTYLLDEDKHIRLSFEDNFRMKRHVEAVLDAL